MTITKKAFDDIDANKFGIVITGCDLSTPENCADFVNGVHGVLVERGVVPKDVQPEDLWDICQTTSTGGRTDLIFIAKPEAKINKSRLAPTKFALPDCCWIDTWKRSYANHYGWPTPLSEME